MPKNSTRPSVRVERVRKHIRLWMEQGRNNLDSSIFINNERCVVVSIWTRRRLRKRAGPPLGTAQEAEIIGFMRKLSTDFALEPVHMVSNSTIITQTFTVRKE